MRMMVLGLFLSVLVLSVAGCETVRGVSKDIGNTARNLSDLLRLGKDIKDVTK